MTGHSVKVYILFTNVRDINYANIIFSPTLLSQHLSVELSVYLIQSVNIVNYLIFIFLITWTGPYISIQAGQLEAWQRIRMKSTILLSDIYNLLLTTLKHHINSKPKKKQH